MSTVQEFHVNGRADLYVGLGSDDPIYLGYSQDGVTVELHYETDDIHTDARGSKIPEDVLDLGQWATVRCNLIKYDYPTLQALQGRLGNPTIPNNDPNTNEDDLSEIGTLMGQCGDLYPLWIRRAYTGCEANIEGGWKFYTAYLADVDSFKIGTRTTIHDITFRALPNASGLLYTVIGTASPS
jgi:hypothetical protein